MQYASRALLPLPISPLTRPLSRPMVAYPNMTSRVRGVRLSAPVRVRPRRAGDVMLFLPEWIRDGGRSFSRSRVRRTRGQGRVGTAPRRPSEASTLPSLPPSLITSSLHTSSPLEFHFVSESVLILQLCTRSLSSALVPPLHLTTALSSPLLHPLFPFSSSPFLCLQTKDQPGNRTRRRCTHHQ